MTQRAPNGGRTCSPVDQWICRICGDSFLYSDLVRRHIAEAHDETMPPSQHEYWKGAEWQRKHKEEK
jgi:hypothetical protein